MSSPVASWHSSVNVFCWDKYLKRVVLPLSHWSAVAMSPCTFSSSSLGPIILVFKLSFGSWLLSLFGQWERIFDKAEISSVMIAKIAVFLSFVKVVPFPKWLEIFINIVSNAMSSFALKLVNPVIIRIEERLPHPHGNITAIPKIFTTLKLEEDKVTFIRPNTWDTLLPKQLRLILFNHHSSPPSWRQLGKRISEEPPLIRTPHLASLVPLHQRLYRFNQIQIQLLPMHHLLPKVPTTRKKILLTNDPIAIALIVRKTIEIRHSSRYDHLMTCWFGIAFHSRPRLTSRLFSNEPHISFRTYTAPAPPLLLPLCLPTQVLSFPRLLSSLPPQLSDQLWKGSGWQWLWSFPSERWSFHTRWFSSE